MTKLTLHDFEELEKLRDRYISDRDTLKRALKITSINFYFDGYSTRDVGKTDAAFDALKQNYIAYCVEVCRLSLNTLQQHGIDVTDEHKELDELVKQ